MKNIVYQILSVVTITVIAITIYMLIQMNLVSVNQVSSFFEHPFILLVTGAVISSIVIPYLTNRWQDHKKKLEIKIELVTAIGKTIAMTIAHIYSIMYDDDKQEKIISEKTERWAIPLFEIEAKLKAYFPNSTIPVEWERYTLALTSFWTVTRHIKNKAKFEKSEYQPIQQFLTSRNDIHWDKLLTDDHNNTWYEIRGELFLKSDYFIDEIIHKKITVF